MLEIGTSFQYDWTEDAYYNEIVTIHGYVYYEGMLYYTCVGESGVEVDIHHSAAFDLAKGE